MKTEITAVGKRRLLKLADFLEQLPRKALKMETWVASRTGEPPSVSEPKCGTTACALGWAAVIPGFRRAGLRLAGMGVSLHHGGHEYVPMYEGYSGFSAGAKFFGMSLGASDHLFGADSYPGDPSKTTPKAVAKRIRKLVADAA